MTNQSRNHRPTRRKTGRQPSNQSPVVTSNATAQPNWALPLSRVITPSSGRLDRRYIEHDFILWSGTATGASFAPIQGNAVAPQFLAYNFQLAQVSNYNNLSLVYDQYRINAVEVKFSLRNPGAATNYPRLSIYPDFDDATPPPSYSAALSHPRVTQHSFTVSQTDFTVALSPRPAAALYQGAFSSFGQPDKPMFVDVNYPTTQHYGLKLMVEDATDTTQFIDIYVKYWITFRNPL
jgi:hypothetical protein